MWETLLVIGVSFSVTVLVIIGFKFLDVFIQTRYLHRQEILDRYRHQKN